jgi:2-dehydropantoate 2-reductase
MQRLAIVGPGAIGCVLAAAIQSRGKRDIVLCGEFPHNEPITIHHRGGGLMVMDTTIIANPELVIGPAQVVFLAVKSYQVDSTFPWLSRLCAPSSVVVALQNGIDPAEHVLPLAKGAVTLPGIAWWAAEAVSPQRIEVAGSLTLTLPNVNGSLAVAALLSDSRISVDLADDFVTASWRKVCVNAVSGLMALVGCHARLFRHSGAQDVARQLASECVRVAQADGAKLSDEFWKEILSLLVALPKKAGTSILYDRLSGHRLEWEVRNDVIRRVGARHGIPTPVSDVIVPLLSTISDIAGGGRLGPHFSPNHESGFAGKPVVILPGSDSDRGEASARQQSVPISDSPTIGTTQICK